jgi:hypothetical protein
MVPTSSTDSPPQQNSISSTELQVAPSSNGGTNDTNHYSKRINPLVEEVKNILNQVGPEIFYQHFLGCEKWGEGAEDTDTPIIDHTFHLLASSF